MWSNLSVQRLVDATKTFDRETANALAAELVEHLNSGSALPPSDASSIVALLRGSRYFEPLRLVTTALIGTPTGDLKVDARVRRQLGQALIELGELNDARRTLQPLSLDPVGSEWAEAKGLRGRSYKQEYVNAVRAGLPPSDALLNASIREYLDAYRSDPHVHTWHGINVVAMVLRGRRDGLTPDPDVDAEAIAQEILKSLAPRLKEADPGVWNFATAAEAQLALGQVDAALERVREYVSPEQKADAFEIASTLRQLEQVWQLREDGPNGAVITVLRTALLAREGGNVHLKVGELQRSIDLAPTRESAFEKVFGKFGPQTLTWYRTGMIRASAVARVETLSGSGVGTGFLIRAGDFFPDLPPDVQDERLLMTNAHVLGLIDPDALRPASAAIRFEALGPQPQTVKVKEIVWESAPDELDATIVRLDTVISGVELIPVAPPDEPSWIADRPRRLYLVGHPHGGELQISLEDNLQLGWKRPLLHYRTPSEPGSSGSPVFDDQWRLIALHHSGSRSMQRLDGPGVYEANEGIWIHEILSKTRASAPAFEASVPAPRAAFRAGVFVSYSHRDLKHLKDLTTVLAPVLNNERLEVWDDRLITPGAEWEREIEKKLEGARVAVLLVSKDFLASGFITQKEMGPILEANRDRGLTIFWIPVGPSYYEATPLARFQAAWDPRRPLTTLSSPHRDAAWVEIAKKLVEALDLSRVANGLKVADQVAMIAELGGSTGRTPRVLARQRGQTLQFRERGHTVETITATEMGTLDAPSLQLIRAYETAVTRLYNEYTEEYPNRVARDAALRQQALQRTDMLKAELCRELNQILDFLRLMGKHLDDHYMHVRAICSSPPGN